MPLLKITDNSASSLYMSEPELPFIATELSDLGVPINKDNLIEVAEALIKKDEPEKAISIFDAILQKENPSISDQIKALLGRAKTLLKNPHIVHKAIPEKDLDLALEILDKNEMDYSKILIAEVRKYLAIIYVRRDDPKAEECFKLGLKACLHEPLAASYVQYLKKNKNYEGALSICRDVLKVNRYSSDFLYESAKINMVLERWREALESMQFFVYRGKLKPSDEREGLDAIVTCHFRMGNLGDAIPHLRKVMTFKDPNPEARAERSKKLLEAKLANLPSELFWGIFHPICDRPERYSEQAAFELFDLLASFKWDSINHCKSLYLRASFCVLLKKREHFESARKNLEEALEGAKTWKDQWEAGVGLIFWRLASLSVLENKSEEAKTFFKKAMQESGAVHLFHEFACFLRDDQKDHQALLDESEELLKKSLCPIAIFYQAEAFFYLNKWDEAREKYDLYLEQNELTHCLAAFDHAAIAVEKKGLLLASYKYRLEAYAYESSTKLIDRHKHLVEMHKNIILITGELTRQQIKLPNLYRFLEVSEACLKREKPEETLQLTTYLLEQELESGIRKEAFSLHAKALKMIDQQTKSKGAEKQTHFEKWVFELLRVKKATEIVPKVKLLLKTREEQIVIHHLEELCDQKREEVTYFIALLEALKKPFSEHPKQHVKFLKLCAEKWKEKKGVDYGKAIRYYKLMLEVLSAHPGVFKESMRKEIEQEIIKAEKEFSKYRVPYIQQSKERAACHVNIGRFSAAIDIYEELLTIEMGEQEKAEIEVLLNYARERHPLQLQAQVQVLFGRATEFYEKRQYDKAIQNYKEILRIGDDPKVLLPNDRKQIEVLLKELQKPPQEEKKE